MTAAHCVDEATDGTVILGAHDRTNAAEPGQVRRTVDAALGHIRWIPSWDPSLLRDDIALIQMPIAVPLSDIIRPVRLPTVDELNIDFAGELAVVSGFGVWSDSVGQSSTVVRFVEENVITNTACNIRYLGKNISNENSFLKTKTFHQQASSNHPTFACSEQMVVERALVS